MLDIKDRGVINVSKYSLGNHSIEVTNVDRDNLYVNDSKVKGIEKDMQKQLEIIRSSLLNISSLLNRCVNLKVVKGNRVDIYKGWARKAKTQGLAAEKLKANLSEKYSEDLKNYPLKLLDDRIAELERKIANMTKE